MSQYELIWHKSARRQLKNMRQYEKPILRKLYAATKDPYQHLRRLTGYSYYKMRVDNYRIIIEIM